MPVVCRVDAKLLDWTSIIHFKFHVKNKTRFCVYNLHHWKKFSFYKNLVSFSWAGLFLGVGLMLQHQ